MPIDPETGKVVDYWTGFTPKAEYDWWYEENFAAEDLPAIREAYQEDPLVAVVQRQVAAEQAAAAEAAAAQPGVGILAGAMPVEALVTNGGNGKMATNGLVTNGQLQAQQVGFWETLGEMALGYGLGWLSDNIFGSSDVPTGTLISNGTTTVPATNGQTIVDGVPISGPGVPEPPANMVANEWRVYFQSKKYGGFWMWYWRLVDGRCMSYHSPTKTWKIWKPKKHIVISKNPRVSNIMKLDKVHKRVQKMLKKYQPKQTKPKGIPAKALSGTYLSTAEKKLLGAGS